MGMDCRPFGLEPIATNAASCTDGCEVRIADIGICKDGPNRTLTNVVLCRGAATEADFGRYSSITQG